MKAGTLCLKEKEKKKKLHAYTKTIKQLGNLAI